MKLGTVEIGQYIKPLLKLETTERKELERLAKELTWKNEDQIKQEVRAVLRQQEIGYSQIDVGFLRLNQKGRKYFYIMPQFAVYIYSKRNSCGSFEDCYLVVYPADKRQRGFRRIKTKLSDFWMSLLKPAILLTRTTNNNNPSYYEYNLASSFNGIIPTEVKTEIQENAERFDEIALIAETSWSEKEIKIDPIIVGRIHTKTYLIAHFQPTEKEQMILEKFVI